MGRWMIDSKGRGIIFSMLSFLQTDTKEEVDGNIAIPSIPSISSWVGSEPSIPACTEVRFAPRTRGGRDIAGSEALGGALPHERNPSNANMVCAARTSSSWADRPGSTWRSVTEGVRRAMAERVEQVVG